MQSLKRLAARRGIRLARIEPTDRLKALLETIKPKRTEHELVRIGGEGDGGYLVPDDLDGIVACFSPGVDVTATFEAAMIGRGIRCFQADASVSDTPLAGEPLVEFDRKFLGISEDAQTITLDRWVAEKMPEGKGDLILQMDIEGAEWLVLAATSDETLARFRIMAIEFHDFDRLYDRFGLDVMGAVFAKIARQFEVVHVHPNNYEAPVGPDPYALPPFIEYTFHRKDRIRSVEPARTFPHPLDKDNVKDRPTVALPKGMYG